MPYEDGALARTSPERFANIREVAKALREHSVSWEQLEEWAEHWDPAVRATLLMYPDIPRQIALRVARFSLPAHGDDKWIIEQAIAACRCMPAQYLYDVFDKGDWLVCAALVNNPAAAFLWPELAKLPAVALEKDPTIDKNKIIRDRALAQLKARG